jgi:N-acyl-D-aspartate/D-glutamate deacylase
MGLRDAGFGFIEIVSDWNEPDARTEFAMLRRVVESAGRPALFSLTQRHEEGRTDVWRELLGYANAASSAGQLIRPVFPPRAIGILLGLEGSQNPFSGTPTYQAMAARPLAERVAAMRQPEVRAKILCEDPIAGATFPLIRRLSYGQMFPFGNPPNYLPQQSDSVAAVAARTGRTAAEVAYDLLIADGGGDFLYAPIVNYHGYALTASETMLANRNAIMGLGDGGAHVGFILDAGFPTWLLTYWGRERRRFPVAELVRRLTSDTAAAAGLADRGVIAVGRKADLNVIDYDRLGFGRPYVSYDLPAGGKRLLQKAEGYVATVVSGVVSYRDGRATGTLAGQLVKSCGAQTLAAQ